MVILPDGGAELAASNGVELVRDHRRVGHRIQGQFAQEAPNFVLCHPGQGHFVATEESSPTRQSIFPCMSLYNALIDKS